jgi:hypothetical protein
LADVLKGNFKMERKLYKVYNGISNVTIWRTTSPYNAVRSVVAGLLKDGWYLDHSFFEVAELVMPESGELTPGDYTRYYVKKGKIVKE